MKPQDILVLLKLAGEPGEWTIRSLATDLGLDPAGVHRALRRLEAAGLLDSRHERVNIANATEFLLHGFRFTFPPEHSGMSRGVPTAWSAPPLIDIFAPTDDPPLVWPDPNGQARGIALKPLHHAVPGLARRDPALGEQLALLDAMRAGDSRVRITAWSELRRRLGVGAPQPR